MENRCMYFAKDEIYQKIKDIGGEWDDVKQRPIVCLIESTEKSGMYWAIPVGSWEHRNDESRKRIESFLKRPQQDLRSCYYHLGKTTIKSIFFISKAIPITDKYIEREYLGHNNKAYIIKNKKLLKELESKLSRILSMENSKNNYFKHKITDIKNILIAELNENDIDHLI